MNTIRATMEKMYKSRSRVYTNIDQRRQHEEEKLKDKRRTRRVETFNVGRSLQEESSTRTEKENKALDRKLALQKYKLGKEAICKATRSKKKPPFVVGIPHHGNSPLLKGMDTMPKKKQCPLNQITNQRTTRRNTTVVEKTQGLIKSDQPPLKTPPKVFPFNNNKSMFRFQMNKIVSVKKLTSPHTPTVLKRSANKCGLPPANDKPERLVMRQKKISPRRLVVCKALQKTSRDGSSSGSEHPLTESEEVPAESAVVASSQPVTSEEQDFTDSSQSIADEDPEVLFQRERVDSESGQLLMLAEEWEVISQLENIPQDIVDEIDSLVGQTRLLTSDKFNQFRRLVDQYESQEGGHKITVEDLNGFWDMVYLQVESLIKRYNNLEKLKRNEWKEEKPITPPKKKRRANIIKKRTVTNKHSCPPRGTEPTPNKTVLSRIRTRDSSSPYIVMRLSGTTRSIGSPTEMNKETAIQDGNASPRRDFAQEMARTETRIKQEPEQQELPQNNASITPKVECADVPAWTPRRSERLLIKTATPKGKSCTLCPGCMSPPSKPLESVKKSGRKIKNQETVNLEDKVCVNHLPSQRKNNKDEELSDPIQVKKSFKLKPSRLVLSSDYPVDLEKPNASSDLHVASSSKPASSHKSSPRPTSARRVTFISGAADKSSIKLPATPYRRSGRKHELISSDTD